jgi:voltage-gated sodium channel
VLKLAHVARTITESTRFRSAILGLVVLNALCLGVDAIPELAEQYGESLFWILAISQAVFVVEIALRITAHHPRPRAFFADSWNRVDFVIVAASLLPAVGSAALAARALRVLRIVRLVSASHVLSGALYADTRGPKVIWLSALTLGIFVYVFALMGVHLFGEWNDMQWGTLGRALGSVVDLLMVVEASAIVSPAFAMSPFTLLYFALLYFIVAANIVNGARALMQVAEDIPAAVTTIRQPTPFLLSVGALVVAIGLAAERGIFLARAEHVISEVTRVTAHNERCAGKRSRYDCTAYAALLRYTVNDKSYFLTVHAGTERGHNRPLTLARHQVGQRVEVVFDPRRPATADRNTFSDVFGGAILFFLIHLTLLVTSFSEPKGGVQDGKAIELGLNRPAAT